MEECNCPLCGTEKECGPIICNDCYADFKRNPEGCEFNDWLCARLFGVGWIVWKADQGATLKIMRQKRNTKYLMTM